MTYCQHKKLTECQWLYMLKANIRQRPMLTTIKRSLILEKCKEISDKIDLNS